MDCIILDAQLPPSLALWVTDIFKISCFSLKHLNLREATDEEIFTQHLAQAIELLQEEDLVEIAG